MSQARSLSIILPVYNESQTITETIQQCVDYMKQQSVIDEYEFLVVNDGSTDASLKILNDLSAAHPSLKVLSHTSNQGYGAALITGIQAAQYERILLMDADGQIKLGSLSDAWPYVNDYDIVSGYRARRMDSAYRRFLGKTYTAFVRLIFGVKSRDINCGFKIFKRKFLDVAGINTHAGAFYTHVFINAQKMGARIREVPIQHFPRAQGHSTGADFNVVTTAMSDVIKLLFSKKK